ncbi:tripartite tricarboxylate transporter TctB family protein [Marinomonas epiphytica]
MQPEQLMALRRADFKTAIILMLISAFVLFESLSFPLTESYAGVQNVWYVSPALFPIIISLLLFLCALVLLVKSFLHIKKHVNTATAIESRSSWWRFFVLVSLIAGQVFGFVPMVDFALSAFIFLFVFIFAFYSDEVQFQKRVFYIWTSVCLLLALLNFTTTLEETSRIYLDWATLAFILSLLIIFRSWALQQNKMKVWRISWKTALIVTLVVCPIFRLGMLVPLPTEGLLIEPMVDVKYLLRDLWRGA